MINNSERISRYMGRISFTGLLVFLLLYSLPLEIIAETKSGREMPSVMVLNPAAELWRDVRQREGGNIGNSQVRGVDSGVLINAYGDTWRKFRMQQLIPIGGSILAGVFILLGIFYMIRGKVPIEGGPSDRKLFRYTTYERMIHWFVASIFLFLAISGLILLFGRPVLIPLMGKEAFSILASACKEGHNLMGPLFLIAVVLIFFRFVRRNIYQRGDLSWLLRGGGIIGSKHVPSNFFNMGEKSMFWLLILVGGLIIASGLVLVFPLFGQGREWMELAHVAHALGALLMIVVIMGHIYIGSVGMEGALEGMTTGYCDLNWAKEHHDHWATEVIERGEDLSNEAVERLRRSEPPGGVKLHLQEHGK
ncbi:MAG: formate dehydrogenase subunit gamma [Candidatus Thiodiazotropha lotti]|uniref:Formate dehydrogenase subunit gamma n=1 Tax=Candidatus Thiodiazotropha lotti TaxID=2792787 RepID=A0A9E4K9L3_9GAMM|nr:formate dehydrogenase subunit gamma [Candidatus Thiodiazotropha lotti]ODB99787.1 formate dehydrogenase subunit gamma [Candidatus Thiodiazotropha endoloripes]MCG7921451.1 formate dehydrogenase subunit gamma [Candidatus Thiodiazotropha lotti]MCG7931689.1 formate dehydrogenase subunit gamma [Candidatus Thiodiazotropha lotti]MCG7941400.1 formate dehydrogenase subunit gamma [Candidatus Thiodiazotropha lotti]